MTAFDFVALVLLLCLLWAGGMWVAWRRIDQLEQANRRLQRRSERAENRADEAEESVRQWAALADERAADLAEHQWRCLGELIPNDSGVRQ